MLMLHVVFKAPGGLFHRKLSASACDNVSCRNGVDELESITERDSLSNHRQNFHVAQGQRELQPNHFPQWNLHAKHSGNSRLADVYGAPPNDGTVARIDTDVHSNLETGMAASVHGIPIVARPEWTQLFQSDNLRSQAMPQFWSAAAPARLRRTNVLTQESAACGRNF